MGMHDRDWYRDLLRERAGLKPRWTTWRDRLLSHRLRSLRLPESSGSTPYWFIAVIWVAIFVALYLLFKLFLRR